MADSTIGDLALQIRSKNAGPFWLTVDIFLKTDEDYAQVANDPSITSQFISRLYGTATDNVRIFRLPDLRVIKISFPRQASAGSFNDRDLHGGQQYVPLSRTVLGTALT